LDSIYGIASNWPPAYSIKIGLIGYNSSVVSKQSPINLVAPGSLGTLKNSINNYSTNFETNTLKALNEAELLLDTVTDPGVEKIVILMSDGIPGIDGYAIKNPYCYTPSPPSCSCGGTYPDCDAWPSCTLDEWISWSSSGCTCIPRTCYCGGTYPNCDAEASCPSGQLQGGCTVDDCYTPAHSSFNPFQKLKYFFAKLLKPESAQAVTTQTQCIYKSCEAAFPDFSCNNSDEIISCGYYWELNCDLTPDVNNQADVIKGKGIALYTIYYNTSNTLEPKQKMCDWSSNNGVGCDDNVYTFAGSDINLMINRVLARIVTKPKDVIVGSSIITDNSLASTTSFVSGALIDSLTCGAIAPKVTFSNNGHLEFSNLKLNYCPAKLHP